jgi:predicted nucleic acid-binding protein
VILVDTNVLLDVLNDNPEWGNWSSAQLTAAEGESGLAIDDIIYAELSIGFEDVRDMDAMVSAWRLQIVPIPRLALFYAGKAFQRYRRAGGAKTTVLPDFFIGAHAAVEGWPLLTRDARRVQTYFPAVKLIAPD